MTDVVGTIRHLEARMEHRFTATDQRIAALDRRIGTLDDKLDSRFLWTIGIQFATFIALLASFLAA